MYKGIYLKTEKLLIVDLDDTIFETRSIDFSQFEGAVNILRKDLGIGNSAYQIDVIIDDFKDYPFDQVVTEHSISSDLQQKLYGYFNETEFKFSVKPFDDYQFLKQMSIDKVLVTTGFRGLQNAKIDALNIRADFHQIHIDDPYDKIRKFKLGIFKELLSQVDISEDQIWVVGDNPDSELKAGRTLGLRTIQRCNGKKEASSFADYHINTFEELAQIIN